MTALTTTATDPAPAIRALDREIEILDARIAELRADADAIERTAKARLRAAQRR